MISKDKFVKTLTFIYEKDNFFFELCHFLENLSPGNYVNFWPNFDYDDVIISLLKESMTPAQISTFDYEYYENIVSNDSIKSSKEASLMFSYLYDYLQQVEAEEEAHHE